MIENFFDNFAKQYDAYNDLVSFGTHHFVKSICVKLLNFEAKQNILDLCCGTGDITRLLQKYSDCSNIVGVDVSQKMLQIAQKKSNGIKFIQANVTNLPFEQNSFDIVTISFGLRNIKDKHAAIKEIERVLAPGGQFLHIDFGKPNNLAQLCFKLNANFVGRFILKDVPFEYFINSINEYWTPEKFEKLMNEYGFSLQKKIEPIFGVISAQLFYKN